MATTIAQVFASKNLWPWFSATITNYYDGSSEKGQDYSNSFGTPIGVPVGGQVMRIVHNDNSIGDVVELQDSSGAVWLYQHITASVRVGQTLQCGSVIGTENGLPVDQYSTGPHIEVRYCPTGWNIGTDSWVEPWVNPASVFSGLGSQTAGSVAAGNPFTAFANAVTGANGRTPITLAPDANVNITLAVLDQILQLTNPFTENMSNIQKDSIAGVSFTDPVAWITQFGVNVVDDLSAALVRLFFILVGLFIFWKVISAFIDFGAVTQTALQAGETVAKGAVMFA